MRSVIFFAALAATQASVASAANCTAKDGSFIGAACGYVCDDDCNCGRCNTKPGCMTEDQCLGACNAGGNAKWCPGSAPGPAPGPAPSTTYKCKANQCVESVGGIDKATCEAVCGPAPGPAPSTTYKCKANQCVESVGGIDKATCEAVCKPAPAPPTPAPPAPAPTCTQKDGSFIGAACGYVCDDDCNCGHCNNKPGCMSEDQCLGTCNSGGNAKWCPGSALAPLAV